jgi:hypothetical protein
VVTTNRRAAAFYRQAQRAVDGREATTALRLAVNADPSFGLAIADLDAITGTASEGPSRQQMNRERHHIEVVRTAASGNARRATDLLREHLASVGCDPLAVRIAAPAPTPRRAGRRLRGPRPPTTRLSRNPVRDTSQLPLTGSCGT